MSQPPPIPPAGSNAARPPPLEYSSASLHPSRPGVVTAIGIISICLGAIGMLGSCASPIQTLMFTNMNNGRGVLMPSAPPSNPAATHPAPLSSTQAQWVVAQVELMANKTMSPTQQSGLRQSLQSPTQQIIVPSSTPQAVVSQIVAAGADSSGTVHFSTAATAVEIQASGTVTTQATSLAASAVSANIIAFFQSRHARIVMGVLGVFNFMLACYLLVVGIMTVRGSHAGARLHRIYAWIKIIAVLCGGAWMVWMTWHALLPSTPSRMMRTGLIAGSVVGGTVALVMGMAYPVALLIILRTRTMRMFYRS